jgi:hypothetical protein
LASDKKVVLLELDMFKYSKIKGQMTSSPVTALAGLVESGKVDMKAISQQSADSE